MAGEAMMLPLYELRRVLQNDDAATRTLQCLPKRPQYEHLSSRLVLSFPLLPSSLHPPDRPQPVWILEGRSMLSRTRTLRRQCRRHQMEMVWPVTPNEPF